MAAIVRTAGAPGLIVVVFTVIAIAPGLFTPHEVSGCVLQSSLETPSWTHPFGRDVQGCEYWTRTLYSTRNSMMIGFSVILGAGVFAYVLGAIAGWRGGVVDTLIMRFSDGVFAIPIILSSLILVGIFEERSIMLVIGVLMLFAWPPIVRVVRSSVREHLEDEHVLAARAMGAGATYTLWRHVLPKSLRPVIAWAMPYMATIISLEAVLSFVGAGLKLPALSWGVQLSALNSNFGTQWFAQAPHLILPGVVMSLLVWALVRFGRRLESHGDPHADIGH